MVESFGAQEAHFENGPELDPKLFARIADFIDDTIGEGGGPLSEQIEKLLKILEKEPQLDEYDNPYYLLTSGLAVELITGFERSHHDIDLVIMDPKQVRHWLIYGTDNVTPGKYWADMYFKPADLTRTAYPAKLPGSHGDSVLCVHPSIILVQKLSNAWGKQPRKRDVADAVAFADFLLESKLPDWIEIIHEALPTLPDDQVPNTIERLQKIFKSLAHLKPY